MWTLYTLQSGTFAAGTDWSAQFRDGGTSSTLMQSTSMLNVPSIADGQSAQQYLYQRNWSDQSVYIGTATVGNPVQISVGGTLVDVTAPGFVDIQVPPGWTLYSITRQSDALDHRGLTQDSPTKTSTATATAADAEEQLAFRLP